MIKIIKNESLFRSKVNPITSPLRQISFNNEVKIKYSKVIHINLDGQRFEFEQQIQILKNVKNFHSVQQQQNMQICVLGFSTKVQDCKLQMLHGKTDLIDKKVLIYDNKIKTQSGMSGGVIMKFNHEKIPLNCGNSFKVCQKQKQKSLKLMDLFGRYVAINIISSLIFTVMVLYLSQCITSRIIVSFNGSIIEKEAQLLRNIHKSTRLFISFIFL